MFSFVKVGLVGLLLLVVLIMTNGCGDKSTALTTTLARPNPAISSAPATTNQLFRGGPSSGSLIGQTIPTIPGLTLKLYNYSVTGFGTELASNSMAARYEVVEDTWFAPSIGQTRGGPSNTMNAYYVQVENGRDYYPKSEAHTSDASFKLLPGDYVVWCSLYWNGQSVEVGTPLRVNVDPNRAILLVEPTMSGNTVSVMVSNAKPNTVAQSIVLKIDTTSTSGQIICTASADNANTVPKNLAYAGTGCSVVPGTTYVSEKLQGRGGGIVWNKPDDLVAGIFLNSLAGDEIRVVKFDIQFTPVTPPATAMLKAYYNDGSEVYLRPDKTYAVATDPSGADCWITFKASGMTGSYRIISDGGSVTDADMTTNVKYWSWGLHKVSLTDAGGYEKASIQVLTFDGSGKGAIR